MRERPHYKLCARVNRKIIGFYTQKGKTRNMGDRTLTCRDCGATFTFTEGEQAFYAQKGFSEPTRCSDCRAAKKAARNNGGGYGDSYGDGGGYGSNGGGGYSRPERVMTQVTCANCGQETEVPFVPRGDKPVYCSDCYNTMGAGSRRSNRY
jgi:CxxC-x17-CxxC domain-containing protein